MKRDNSETNSGEASSAVHSIQASSKAERWHLLFNSGCCSSPFYCPTRGESKKVPTLRATFCLETLKSCSFYLRSLANFKATCRSDLLLNFNLFFVGMPTEPEKELVRILLPENHNRKWARILWSKAKKKSQKTSSIPATGPRSGLPDEPLDYFLVTFLFHFQATNVTFLLNNLLQEYDNSLRPDLGGKFSR